MADHRISVIDLAAELGRRKQYVFKVLRRLGIDPVKERSSSSAGQFVSYITQIEANRVREEFSVTFAERQGTDADAAPESFEQGYFYLLLLEPEHDPGRIKVGFASNLSERLRQHRCSAPFARIVQSWPCKRLWEKTVIDCIACVSERLHTEVFRTDDISIVVDRCNAIFSLLSPDPKSEAETPPC